MIFAEKSGNLCKNHTFSPDAENINKPYGFIGILGEFSPKTNFALKINIFTRIGRDIGMLPTYKIPSRTINIGCQF